MESKKLNIQLRGNNSVAVEGDYIGVTYTKSAGNYYYGLLYPNHTKGYLNDTIIYIKEVLLAVKVKKIH